VRSHPLFITVNSVENDQANGPTTRPGPRPAAATRGGRPLSPARAFVLDALREAGRPVTLAELSATTGLHPNTLREHLEPLVARGPARRERAAPTGRGRPAWLYTAVAPGVADPASSTEYAGLAAALAAHIHRSSPDPKADAVAAGRAWGRELARKAGPPASRGPGAARRQVARLLDDVGFCPEADDRVTDVLLTRCPLLEAAREYPDVVCGVHLGIVRGALEEYGADSSRTHLQPFSDPDGCRLHLLTPQAPA
jgi:predicted ArsR family transcriptional regulator